MTEAISSTPVQTSAVALFISDLHLQEAHPRTTQAFYDFLNTHARHAKQLYLLGDLFEYWAGDDDLETPYNQRIVDALRQISDADVEVFWIAGNRDFLVGQSFAQAAGLTLLSDPFVATIAGRRVALAHGDAQCTDDLGYMAFRAQVRNPQWQQQFLSLPLTQRKTIIAGARDESRKEQQNKSMDIMDVNQQAIAALFAETGTDTLIHGHTHRPALHVNNAVGVTLSRYVLSDWDYDAITPRGGWILIDSDGVIRRFDHDGSEFQRI